MGLFKKRIFSKKISAGLLIGGCTILGTASAQDVAPAVAMAPGFVYTPGISVYGLAGNGWTIMGDGMAPLFGQPLSFYYINPQVYYHSDEHEASGSMGVGHRVLTPNYGILGAYVFGDYNHSINGNDYWFVSPGIERLGQVLDFSANLYIPVTSRLNNEGLKFADEEGDYSQINFNGHTQYDELVNTFESVGLGGDAQVGIHTPFRNSKVYLGGYYFDPKNHDGVGGGYVRAEVPVTSLLSAVISEAYDSEYHNTLKAGLTLVLGGRSTGFHYSPNLADHMVDPIQRNAIALSGGAHNFQPVVQGYKDTNQVAIEKSNISFFVPGGNAPSADGSIPSGDGTYENPYQGMSQNNVDNANAQNNRNFYINSGVYNAVYNPMVSPDFIVLNNDQLYGRSNNFTQTAYGSSRPLINFSDGGFLVPGGDVSDSFNNLRLAGRDVSGTAGIFVDHETGGNVNVSINDLLIKHFGDGIDIYNANDNAVWVTIKNSVISDNNVGGVDQLRMSGYGGGVAGLNTGSGLINLTLLNSKVTDNHNNDITDNWGGIGVYNVGSGTFNLNVIKSEVSNNVTPQGGEGSSANSAGILLENEGNGGTINALVSKSKVNYNDDGIAVYSDAYGNKSASNNTNLFIKNSSVDKNRLNGLLVNSGAGESNVYTSIWNSEFNENDQDGIQINHYGSGDVNLYANSIQLNNNQTGLNLMNSASGETDIVIKNSQINENTDDGLDINNINSSGAVNLTLKNASLNDNLDTGINIFSQNSTGDVTATISKATITGSNYGINVSSLTTTSNPPSSTDVLLDIDHSSLTNNNFGLSLSSTAFGVGGSNISANISDSVIAFNKIAGISASSSATAIGSSKVNANTTVSIDNSLITGNAVGVIGNSFVGASNVSGSSALTTINITNSSIILNGVGVSANAVRLGTAPSNTVVNIDQSVVAGNLVALAAYGNGTTIGNGNATINVIDPVYFRGTLEGNGHFNFPNLSPTGGQKVVCSPLFSPAGSCVIVN